MTNTPQTNKETSSDSNIASDKKLILEMQEAYQVGDESKVKRLFEDIYNRYDKSLSKSIEQEFRKYNVKGNMILVEDIETKTWEVAWLKLPNPQKFTWQGKSVLAWLTKIANNKIKQEFAKSKRQKDLRDEFIRQLGLEPSLLDKENLETTIGILKSSIKELNPYEQKIINLRYFEGWSINKIAKILKKKSNTITKAHGRALKKLEKSIKNERGRDVQKYTQSTSAIA